MNIYSGAHAQNQEKNGMKYLIMLLAFVAVANASQSSTAETFSGVVVNQDRMVLGDRYYNVIYTTSDTLVTKNLYVDLVAGDSINIVDFPEDGVSMLCPDRGAECFDLLDEPSLLIVDEQSEPTPAIM